MFDAVILSGGRSSRLGGVPKASLQIGDRNLLALTCEAASAARRLLVVGQSTPGMPGGVELLREDPPFGGPAAAVAAAVGHLRSSHAPWLLVLACDMPRIGETLPALLTGAREAGASVLARDGGRDQPLAALYRWSDLASAVDSGALTNLSMRHLLARVQWSAVEVPAGSTHDVDTWSDAQELGIEEPYADQ
nr:NTP transferase domain-containing protein [Arthrobacter pigmenti]